MSKQQAVTQGKSNNRVSAFGHVWQGWIRPMIIGVVVMTSVRSAVADWNDVPSGSMKPTIVVGDRVFVNKLAYSLRLPCTRISLVDWADPERGDIVTFWGPGSEIRMIKRVVALPGDTVALRDGRLSVNGVSAVYTAQPGATGSRSHLFDVQLDGRQWTVQFASVPPVGSVALRSMAPVTLGPDEYFILGDNRDNSMDSRFYGPVTRDRIIGRANSVVLSLDREQYYAPRHDRWFTPLN